MSNFSTYIVTQDPKRFSVPPKDAFTHVVDARPQPHTKSTYLSRGFSRPDIFLLEVFEGFPSISSIDLSRDNENNPVCQALKDSPPYIDPDLSHLDIPEKTVSEWIFQDKMFEIDRDLLKAFFLKTKDYRLRYHHVRGHLSELERTFVQDHPFIETHVSLYLNGSGALEAHVHSSTPLKPSLNATLDMTLPNSVDTLIQTIKDAQASFYAPFETISRILKPLQHTDLPKGVSFQEEDGFWSIRVPFDLVHPK